MKNLSFLIFIITCSCTQNQKNWSGGVITNEGTYSLNGNTITVYEKDVLLMYSLIDEHGDTLLHQDDNISTFHKWALHLDDKMNLWVLSSDIGHSCWERDSETGEYNKHEFYGAIEKDSIPEEVYITLSRFHPYSSMKKD